MEPKQLPPYPIRMPQDLRQRLEESAVAGGRSLHAEILGRLIGGVNEERMEPPPDDVFLRALAREAEIIAHTERLKAELKQINEDLPKAYTAIEGAKTYSRYSMTEEDAVAYRDGMLARLQLISEQIRLLDRLRDQHRKVLREATTVLYVVEAQRDAAGATPPGQELTVPFNQWQKSKRAPWDWRF